MSTLGSPSSARHAARAITFFCKRDSHRYIKTKTMQSLPAHVSVAPNSGIVRPRWNARYTRSIRSQACVGKPYVRGSSVSVHCLHVRHTRRSGSSRSCLGGLVRAEISYVMVRSMCQCNLVRLTNSRVKIPPPSRPCNTSYGCPQYKSLSKEAGASCAGEARWGTEGVGRRNNYQV